MQLFPKQDKYFNVVFSENQLSGWKTEETYLGRHVNEIYSILKLC